EGLTPQPDTICVATAPRFVNAYSWFTDQPVWPRGYPLDRVLHRQAVATERRPDVRVGVWQGLVDGEADVDAIYRLTHRAPVRFRARDRLARAAGVFCPSNSQNTFWSPEAYAYLYLPFTVTFRFTDILRGYVAQRGLHALGLHVAFCQASVFQDRNPH